MDSLTHIALGGLIGEATLGKQLGKRALLYGALAQSLPDIDFVSSLWLETSHNLLAHRGITHSFLFVVLLAPTLAWTFSRWHRSDSISFRKWLFFFGIQILIHQLIDSLNAYGVGWFEPFSRDRFSFNVIFVADPFYSVTLGVALLVLLILPINHEFRKRFMLSGLIISSMYLVYTLYNKMEINRETKEILDSQQIPSDHYFTTPTPLNNWLWYIVVKDKKGYHVGHRSVFDQTRSIHFYYFPQYDSLLKPFHGRQDIDNLVRFADGYYTSAYHGDTLIFNVLRFGQQAGWYNPEAPFVFQYDLTHPDQNSMVTQKGRFAGWNKTTLRSLWKRIKGN